MTVRIGATNLRLLRSLGSTAVNVRVTGRDAVGNQRVTQTRATLAAPRT